MGGVKEQLCGAALSARVKPHQMGCYTYHAINLFRPFRPSDGIEKKNKALDNYQQNSSQHSSTHNQGKKRNMLINSHKQNMETET